MISLSILLSPVCQVLGAVRAAGSDQLSGQLQRPGHDGVHVVVFIFRQAAQQVQVGEPLCQRPVSGIQCVVLPIDDGVIGRLLRRAGVGPGELLHDSGPALQLLARHVLEFGDAGVGLVHSVVHCAPALEPGLVQGLEPEVQGAVGEGTEAEAEEQIINGFLK